MVVGPARDQVETPLPQGLGQSAGVADHPGLVVPEGSFQGFLEGHGLGRDHVHQRPALHPGENPAIKLFPVPVAAEDQSPARPPHGLVGGHGDEIAAAHRVGMKPRGHQPGDVGDIGQEHGSGLVGNRPKSGEIDDPGVGAGPADDEPGTMGEGQVPHLVVIDQAGAGLHPVEDHPIKEPGKVYVQPVAEVAAVRKVHGQDGVAGVESRHQDGEVGLGPGVGLDIGVLGPEKFPGPGDRQFLHPIDPGAAPVVASAGVALGVFVGQGRTQGQEHLGAGVVLGGNQDQLLVLARDLAGDAAGDLRIEFPKFIHLHSFSPPFRGWSEGGRRVR